MTGSETATEAIGLCDVNGDNKIDLEEFICMLLKEFDGLSDEQFAENIGVLSSQIDTSFN